MKELTPAGRYGIPGHSSRGSSSPRRHPTGSWYQPGHTILFAIVFNILRRLYPTNVSFTWILSFRLPMRRQSEMKMEVDTYVLPDSFVVTQRMGERKWTPFPVAYTHSHGRTTVPRTIMVRRVLWKVVNLCLSSIHSRRACATGWSS